MPGPYFPSSFYEGFTKTEYLLMIFCLILLVVFLLSFWHLRQNINEIKEEINEIRPKIVELNKESKEIVKMLEEV